MTATHPSSPPSLLRRGLERFYTLCGLLAGGFIIAITTLVILQVGANAIDRIAEASTGKAIGLMVPSYAEFTGFFLVAASFLALPYAFHHGAHIRVGLVLSRLGCTATRWINVGCLIVALALSLYASWYCVELVLESHEFGDMSSGLIPVPLWIPQSGMAIGMIGLAVAVLDDLILCLMGRTPSFEAAEAGADAASSFER